MTAPETYEEYVERLASLNLTNPLPRDRWARMVEWEAWQSRIGSVENMLTDEEVEKLAVELRNKNASHERYLVTVYKWATDCPHDTSALEPPTHGVGDGPYEDEHHKRDEDGDLFCLLSPVGEECVCGDGYCERLSELRTEAEDFWERLAEYTENHS